VKESFNSSSVMKDGSRGMKRVTMRDHSKYKKRGRDMEV
jgi:hypothetical protein